jgi:hypothetical protein
MEGDHLEATGMSSFPLCFHASPLGFCDRADEGVLHMHVAGGSSSHSLLSAGALPSRARCNHHHATGLEQTELH